MSTETPVPQTAVDNLQFHRAETDTGAATSPTCVACKNALLNIYFTASGQLVCSTCAKKIKLGTQAPPTSSLAKAALYGGGAALAGCALYATVAIVTGMEIGLIAILVGFMVGKAIRHASDGLGGRAQQILAVVLTYFAITTSYIPVFVYENANSAKPTAAQTKSDEPSHEKISAGAIAVTLLALCAAAPFLSLSDGSGVLTLLIIFFGLSRAWRLTGRSKVSLAGPFQLTTG